MVQFSNRLDIDSGSRWLTDLAYAWPRPYRRRADQGERFSLGLSPRESPQRSRSERSNPVRGVIVRRFAVLLRRMRLMAPRGLLAGVVVVALAPAGSVAKGNTNTGFGFNAAEISGFPTGAVRL